MLELTDKNFDSEVINSKDVYLVDFWAEWCRPCKSIFSILEKIAIEYKERLKIRAGRCRQISRNRCKI